MSYRDIAIFAWQNEDNFCEQSPYLVLFCRSEVTKKAAYPPIAGRERYLKIGTEGFWRLHPIQTNMVDY